MSNTVVTLENLPSLVGTNLGHTGWLEITQERIDQFAVATGDDQWIHVDPVRAADGPFGTTIAHGFLTLSLLIPFWGELLDVDGVRSKVNYGLDRVRFTSPVPVGSRLRMTATITEITDVKDGVQITIDAIIEAEGSTRPAVVVTFLCRFYA
ncbi:enoyl-CoA hydratase [Subtercola boreus]|uniref:Enoyl-CoA hydratase n=1 Tax=Subtercola boreus TaxID=120213 RepID=A0A3E0VGQ7_9MICO|nr:MaoC family dehydratase [Subtercola boreus]RFA09102.1 enoyl-CoA hydratase [Subtercola boreus]TQL53891.1 acyl dehydratase [Subtercola boreus]